MAAPPPLPRSRIPPAAQANDRMASVFVNFKYRKVRVRENLFSPNSKNLKSAKSNSRENFTPRGIAVSVDVGIVYVFVFQASRVRFHPDL